MNKLLSQVNKYIKNQGLPRDLNPILLRVAFHLTFLVLYHQVKEPY
ncbi:hypothetical protein pb186bvf_004942 [Paramecium bursaria]